MKRILGIPKLRDEPAESISNEHVDDGSDNEEQDGAAVVDLANTSSSSADTAMEATSDQPIAAIRTEPQSEMVVNDKRTVECGRSAPRLINLSTPSTRTDDVGVKRTRSLGATGNEQEQPASKKPLQVDNESSAPYISIRRDPARQREIEDEVMQSCQSITWPRGPLPKNIDHWFYDLRTVFEPPERLVSESRLIVLAWKKALGQGYFPFTGDIVGWQVRNLEHAVRQGQEHRLLGFKGM